MQFFCKVKFCCCKAGFTLVELLVVVSLMALISALVLANIRSGNTNVLLKNAGNELVVAARQAQNLTLSGTAGPTGAVPQNGYSIKIFAENDFLSPNSYAIFAEYNAGPQIVGGMWKFPPRIQVIPPLADNYYQVKFLPQNQGIELVNGDSATEMRILLRNDNAMIRTLYVNAVSGLIELQ